MNKRICLIALLLLAVCASSLAEADDVIVYARVKSENGADTCLYELPGEYRNVVATLKNDAQIIILFEGSTWHKVQLANSGVTGWIRSVETRVTSRGKSAIDYGCALGRTCAVRSSDGFAALRWGPGLMYDVIDNLPVGRFAWVYEIVDTWSRVLLEDGRVGYISSNLLQGASRPEVWPQGMMGYVQVSGNSANFREAANYSSRVVSQLSTGDVVEILGQTNYFYEILESGKGRTGFISADIVSPEGLNEIVRYTSLYYDNPDAYYADVIFEAPVGQKVKVLASNGYVSRVEYGDVIGYVYDSALKY